MIASVIGATSLVVWQWDWNDDDDDNRATGQVEQGARRRHWNNSRIPISGEIVFHSLTAV
jgi:hypothetical protein